MAGPRSREKNITGQGKSVERRGRGLGSGPVGNTGRFLATELFKLLLSRAGSNGRRR